jgi:alcohol dehydrogenase class IV
MGFEFATAGRIVFGSGTLAGIGGIAREHGHRALVVTGRDPARAARLIGFLAAADISAQTFPVAHEPTTDDVVRGMAVAREAGCDFAIGIGGGAAIDAAKAIAALLTNGGELHDYLEVIGQGKPLAQPSAPCLAIPTTAGTGAEVTRNAVLASVAHRVKVSLRSPHMLPKVALVDAELTYDLPPTLTASTGLDALTQLIEPYVSIRANPIANALCVDGIRRVARSLRIAVERGRDAAAREDMALASLYGGLALANAGLGAVHGFAGPIGGMFPAPHGAVCGALLPGVMETNLRALRSRLPQSPALERYAEIGRLLTGRPQASADDGVRWVRGLVAALSIPPLRTYGITAAESAGIAHAAMKASSMKANPLPLTQEELTATLERAI